MSLVFDLYTELSITKLYLFNTSGELSIVSTNSSRYMIVVEKSVNMSC